MLPNTASASQDPSQAAPAVDPPTGVTNVEPPQPLPLSLPGKKTTRHWEAWTHNEEENFFLALRQVGKNFEKITSRVQSKNKDQVRHYYYRLIKRMNKLLGPDFVLDAKNSKDVNSAMLRWWALLEKHSCPASKLHLKPRRFKNFISALEHQLLKDRRKATKKRAPPAEPLATAAARAGPVPGKSISESLKVVAGGESRPQKTSSARTSTGKRKIEPHSNRSKGESSHAPRQRKKASDDNISVAAYKRWEKAASAGVTLVAEAAEQLERAAVSDQPEPAELGQTQMKHCSKLVPGIQLSTDKGTRLGPLRVDAVARDCDRVFDMKALADCNADQVVKLKLQLFPVDDSTCKSMEQDGLNPHLELTLKSRKAISSVLHHLTQKWGRASAASGELRLFPFNMQWKNLPSCQGWSSRDVSISAEEVYALVGKPPVFRLKYGWMPHRVLQSSNAQLQQQPSLFISSGGIEAAASCGLQSSKQSNDNTEAALQGGLQSGKQTNAIYESVCLPPSLTNIPDVRSPQFGVGNILGTHSCETLCNTYAWQDAVTGNGCHDASSKKLPAVPVEFLGHEQTARGLALPTSTSGTSSLGSNAGVKQNALERKALHSIKCLGGKSNIFTHLGAASVSMLLPGKGEADCTTDQKVILSAKASSKGQEGSGQCCWQYEESNDGFAHMLLGIEDTSNNGILLPIEMDWVDSFANISVGELLNDASLAEQNQVDTAQAHQMMQSLDSFDAAVAAQGACFSKAGSQPLHQSQTSVWDGEDTCDGFSFHKVVFQKQDSISSSSALEHSNCQEPPKDLTVVLSDFGSLEAWKHSFSETEIQCQELKADLGPESSQQNVEGLTGKQFSSLELYWADSLGSLDLGVPSSRCAKGQDVLLPGDLSLGSLGGNSLDAFQGCSSQGNEQRVLSTSGFQNLSNCTKGVCSGNLQELATV